jgi:hypothetical protein
VRVAPFAARRGRVRVAPFAARRGAARRSWRPSVCGGARRVRVASARGGARRVRRDVCAWRCAVCGAAFGAAFGARHRAVRVRREGTRTAASPFFRARALSDGGSDLNRIILIEH